MEKHKIKFPKGIHTVHIPFMALTRAYRELYDEIEKLEYPKTTRRIEATYTVAIDLKHGTTSYEAAEVKLMK